MRSAVIVAIIAAIIVCIVLGLWIVYSSTQSQTVTKTMCNVVKEELIKRTIPINDITWIEIIEGKKVVKQCKLVELVKKHVCVIEEGIYRCFDRWEERKVLKTWNETAIENRNPKICVRVNLAAYKRVWSSECRRDIEYSKAVSRMHGVELRNITFVLRHAMRYYFSTEIIYDVPYPVLIPSSAKLFDCDTYVKHVLVPSFKTLAKIFN